MNIFKTKRRYVVETKSYANREMQDFIKKYAIEGTGVSSGYDTHVYGSLFQDEYNVRYTFVTRMKKKDIDSKLIEAFGANYRVNIGRKLTFVYKKEEESA